MPLGWWTDLEVARRSGAHIAHREGYVAVHTVDNPDYYWGNYVLVPGDWNSARSRSAFAREFPTAEHLAVGFLSQPNSDSWSPLAVEVNEVRVQRQPPQARAVQGYEARPLTGDDWRQSWSNETQGMPQAYGEFAWRRIEARQRMVANGSAVFMGAFRGGDLVADLGVVMCGTVARYQSVMTLPDHRGRGLASWLMARAGQWAHHRAATEWVIVVEPGSAAARLYQNLGFGIAEHAYQVEKTPVADEEELAG